MYDDDEQPQIDITKLRYVLYARKSTDDPKRQVRSTNDQIDECQSLAKRLGINIVATIREEKSAKKPGNRVRFDVMLKAVGTQYDAIISWSPDRLARNVLEGSTIMNMLDNHEIKDLKFVTHYFTNNASGKMLLGISFVMADYYSKNLAENVSRGVKHGLKQDKSSGTPKHGYTRSEDGIYRPDGKNYDLICDAWHMRKQGKSLEAIAKYMNDAGYARIYKDKAKRAGQKILMSDKILSARVFPDPFYYGVLIQKGKPVDLREVPGYNFQPATDEATYNHVQLMTGRRAMTERKRAVFKPLARMVICWYCKSLMTPQTPLSGRKSEKMRILSYRCDTPNCPRKNKDLKLAQSVRAKVIFNSMYEMLRGFKVTREDYDRLCRRLATANSTKLQETAVKVHSKQGALKIIDREIKDRSLKIIDLDPTSPIYTTNEAHINELEVQRQELNDDINKLRSQVTDPQQDVLSFEDFLNVANKADLHLRAADVGAKDRIARLIYLNVVVDTEKVVDYQIREPFRTYFQMHKISSGRGGGI